MGHRLAELVDNESIATAGTRTVDLDMNEPISRITVQLRLVNNGSTPTAHPATAVSKIEVCDGSDLLFSMSGKECSALNYYDKGYLPFSLCAYEDNIYSTVEFHLDFGRFLWDPILALDPKKFTNLQIKVTHNKATGASSPDAGYISVVAHIFDDANISPIGFLMSKQVYSYALSASGQERIVLPTDYDFRKILFGSLSAGNSPTSQLASVKLSVDNDKRVLVNNIGCSDLVKMLAIAKAEEAIIGMGSGSAINFFIAPTYEVYCNVSPMNTPLAVTVDLAQAQGGRVSLLSDASEAFQLRVSGYAPHGHIALPQGDQLNPDDWLNVSKFGNIALTITAGSSVGASSTAEVILQQKRTY